MERKSGGNKSSKEDLKNRYDIGIRLIQEKKYQISEPYFDAEYKKRIKSELGKTLTSSQLRIDKLEILVRILPDMPEFKFLKKTLNKNNEDPSPTYSFLMPFSNYESNLSAIYLQVPGNKKIQIFEPANNELSDATFTAKSLMLITGTLSDANNISNDEILSLRIYFTQATYSGFETVICDIYERSIKSQSLNIISTSAKHLSCDIEFHYEDLEKILLFTYRLFGKYWKGKKSK